MRRLTWPLTALTLALSACGTMEHTNTMVFATSTKTALDISEEPTGTVGITLGYKRLEAVWMPLLPNQGEAGHRTPAACGHKVTFDTNGKPTGSDTYDCPKFEGSENGTNRDTYSVIATFSGQVAGSAGGNTPQAEAKGSIVQFFATGIAAQKLAGAGGNAALFNTGATASPSAEVTATAIKELQAAAAGTALVMAKVTDSANGIDQGKLTALLTKAKAATPPLPGSQETAIQYKAKQGAPTLEKYLRFMWSDLGQTLSAAAAAI